MEDMTEVERNRRVDAYPKLVEALQLTTMALHRAGTFGSVHRVEENHKLLIELGETIQPL